MVEKVNIVGFPVLSAGRDEIKGMVCSDFKRESVLVEVVKVMVSMEGNDGENGSGMPCSAPRGEYHRKVL